MMNLSINKLVLIEIIITVNLLLNNVCCNNDNLPCKYNETVDLTNSIKFSNGSYLYDGIEIPQYLTGIFDHKFEFSNKIETKPHLRGCICKLRKCINWCCNKNEIFDTRDNKCIDVHTLNDTNVIKHDLEIRLSDGINVTRNLLEYFYPLHNRRPCNNMYPLKPYVADYDEFNLLENGDLKYLEDNTSLSIHMHCIALDTSKDINIYALTAYVCSSAQDIVEAGSRDYFYMIGFMIAIPFMVATLLVYAIIPELRTLHGKSLICYLIGLIIGYSGLIYVLLTQSKISVLACTSTGYAIYYFFMSSFFWLNVICFDLWWNFTGRKISDRIGQGKRFLLYCFYSYGVPLIFLIIVLPIDFSTSIPEPYRIGIGADQCFIKNEDWSAMIYFYAPILILIIANIVFFILTAKKIRDLQHDMSRIMSEKDNFRNLRSEQNNFGLFLKLFILMGITWILEIISYVVGEKKRYLFHVSDFCNMMQGLLIFVFFVMKPNVWRLIKKKFGKQSPTINSSFQSTKITHINVNQNIPLKNSSNSQTLA